jgi:acyl carrier protein
MTRNAAAPESVDREPSVARQLRQILAEVTGNLALLDASPDTALLGTSSAGTATAGLDSLTGTLLLRRLHQHFGVDVAGEDLNLDSLATLATLAAFIAERTAG